MPSSKRLENGRPGKMCIRDSYGAAFNEASGASACHFGFNIPVETNAPPKG